nr:hypothetical protein [Tanacetum cinerariifolium]
MYNGRKGIGFENPSYFCKEKDLRPTLYDERVINLGYTLMFLTHSDEALEIEKFKKARENKIEFAYDYESLNASYVNEKINFADDYFQEIINPDFDKIDSLIQQTSSLKQYVPTMILEKIIIDLEDEVIVQICLWIIDSGCSKHMMGNRALLTNFVEKFLGTVRFGNNDFAVIVGYGDVGLEVAFRKSTYFVRTEDGVDLLTGDRSSNLYTISLNEVASNSSTCLLAKASSLQSWLWHQRLSHLNFVTINNLVKNNLVQSLPKMKFKKDHLCSACEKGRFIGNITSSKRILLQTSHFILFTWICMDVGKLKEKGDIEVFVGSEPGLSNLNETGKSLNPLVLQVSETSKKDLEDLFHNFYDEYFDASKIMKSLTTNDETSNVEIPSHEEEVFHESFESFQKVSSSSSLDNNIQQSSEEVGVPSSNTQSISNNMIPNVDEASTSHNVFNERLEDAFFDASTSFHDPSNVHTFYQPYPHEKKWTKDHPLHKIIGDPKSSVRTRGQLANSCLFSCLLSSIEPANVAETLRGAHWVSAMQEELDQFARLKVSILVPRPEGKTIIKTKWIFKNKKDESSLVIQNKARLVATAFLNGILKEEVYIGQPSSFVSTQYPDHVYALDKVLYGLKQAPRTWYDILSPFLIDSGFQKGSIDTTLFIKKKGKHIMLIQIYVDDIIFGSTNLKYCTKFSELMVKSFEMSMMGEMKFFSGFK